MQYSDHLNLMLLLYLAWHFKHGIQSQPNKNALSVEQATEFLKLLIIHDDYKNTFIYRQQ
jgi:hypothetical protein